ncbi:MAG: ABC transporter substrate-binding protein [Thermodesulfobacteriota bacterium]|nr:ABC transporter substrate-binding protein [Thermodesulfobacteriota bacterium]
MIKNKIRPPFLIGLMIAANYADFERPHLYDEYPKTMKRLYPENQWNNSYVGGIANARIIVLALEKAGRNLTRESLIDAMETIKGYDGLGPAINFSEFDPDNPDCRRAANTVYLQECLADGTPKILTGWLTAE